MKTPRAIGTVMSIILWASIWLILRGLGKEIATGAALIICGILAAGIIISCIMWLSGFFEEICLNWTPIIGFRYWIQKKESKYSQWKRDVRQSHGPDTAWSIGLKFVATSIFVIMMVDMASYLRH